MKNFLFMYSISEDDSEIHTACCVKKKDQLFYSKNYCQLGCQHGLGLRVLFKFL